MRHQPVPRLASRVAAPIPASQKALQTRGMEMACLKIKKPAAPYSPAGESRSTLGEEALDFRVRNGNGYDSLSMATGKRFAEPTV